MSMSLHSRIRRNDLRDPAYDFLRGVEEKVQRMDECHPTPDNDAHYVFLVWLKNENDHFDVLARMKKNAKNDDWSYEFFSAGDGLIIVSTWC